MIAAALFAASLAAAEPGVPAALTRGDWNERIHATHALGEAGLAGLPGLRVAAGDADWQVRMTAVHLMGRAGEAAVPDLARILTTEPCRHVRLTALHWLGSIGTPAASEAIRASLHDESGMVRLVGRYWLGKDEAPALDADPDATRAEEEDLKRCEASSAPGRAPWADKVAAPPPAPGEIDEVVVTPDPTVKRPATPVAATTPATPEARPSMEKERLDELDALLNPRTSERGTAAFEATERVGAPDRRVEAKNPKGTAESFPVAPPGIRERGPSESAGAEIMPDAGTGKPEGDPVPDLIKLLHDADAKARARAADELGKRGSAAMIALKDLTAALKDKDRRVRSSAALALGNLGPLADASVPALIAALKRGPEEVEWSAAIALGRIGTTRSKRAFARYARQSAGDFLKGSK